MFIKIIKWKQLSDSADLPILACGLFGKHLVAGSRPSFATCVMQAWLRP